MVVVYVLAEQAVIRSYIAFEIGIIRTSRVNHDAFDGMLLAGLVAFIFGQNKLIADMYDIYCEGTREEWEAIYGVKGYNNGWNYFGTEHCTVHFNCSMPK